MVHLSMSRIAVLVGRRLRFRGLGLGDMRTDGGTRTAVEPTRRPVSSDGQRGDGRDSLSVLFPVHHDESPVRRVTEKALRICGEVASSFEVSIYRTIVDLVRWFRRVLCTEYELPEGEPARAVPLATSRR
jgi:hypothetical protein